jgi:DNA-binding transcriptional LysR family regulator
MWQWDDVRFFLAVSRHGSLSGAARVLRVNHATVGRRIAVFEEQLGSKLFDRTPEGFALTVAGQAILDQCEGMEKAAASVDRLVAGHDARLSGLVRVATTEGLARALIVPALATLAREHAQLQIEVMASPARLDITRRQADIAVRLGRPADPDVICRRLGDCGFALYSTRSYLTVHGTSHRADGLTGQVAVSYLGAPTWFSAALGGARVALFSNSPFVQLEAATASMCGGTLYYTPDITVANPVFQEVYDFGPCTGASVFTLTPDDRFLIMPIAGIQSPGDPVYDRDYSGEHSRRVVWCWI